MPSST
jgi:hypothetical protein